MNLSNVLHSLRTPSLRAHQARPATPAPRAAGLPLGFRSALRAVWAGGWKILACVMLALAPMHAAHAQPAAAQTQPLRGVPAVEVVSPGGIRAWLVSNSTVPMIVMSAYWRGGAAIEDPRVTGITSVMANLLTEGAGAMDGDAFKVRLEELNMSLAFSGDWDGIDMDLVTLSANRDAAFDMARQALTAPRFEAGPLERIKRQLLVGIRTRETNPGYLGNLALDQALIPNHPYARRSSVANVAAIDRAGIVALHRNLIRRDGLLITVVGDIDARTLGPLLDRTFGALPAGGAVAVAPHANIAAATPLIVRPLPQPQSLILFTAPGIPYEDPDWIALAVANYILGGGGFSSKQLRRQWIGHWRSSPI